MLYQMLKCIRTELLYMWPKSTKACYKFAAFIYMYTLYMYIYFIYYRSNLNHGKTYLRWKDYVDHDVISRILNLCKRFIEVLSPLKTIGCQSFQMMSGAINRTPQWCDVVYIYMQRIYPYICRIYPHASNKLVYRKRFWCKSEQRHKSSKLASTTHNSALENIPLPMPWDWRLPA